MIPRRLCASSSDGISSSCSSSSSGIGSVSSSSRSCTGVTGGSRSSPGAQGQAGAGSASLLPCPPDKHFIHARNKEDWEGCAEILKSELGVNQDLSLVPLLTGCLEHIIDSECESGSIPSNSKTLRRGAYSKAVSLPDAQEEQADGNAQLIWSHMARALFCKDAALALESKLLSAYTSEPFSSELAELQEAWRARGTGSEIEYHREVQELCRDRVLGAVLPQFGYPADEDLQEILGPYMGSNAVESMSVEVQMAVGSLSHRLPLAPDAPRTRSTSASS